MPPDIADLKHEEWEERNGSDNGKRSFFVEAFRTIEVVGPQMEIRAASLEDALETAEDEIHSRGSVLSNLQWDSRALKHCFIQEDTIKVRRVE